MTRSFLLKDNGRRVEGYLQVRSDEIRCRVESELSAVLILLGMKERKWRFELQAGGREQCFPAVQGEISGAVVMQEGAVWLATDDIARCRFSKHAVEPERKKEEEAECRKETAEPSKPADEMQKSAAWPQRRWPPPPCCPQAMYQRGLWYADKEAAVCLLFMSAI